MNDFDYTVVHETTRQTAVALKRAPDMTDENLYHLTQAVLALALEVAALREEVSRK